MPREKRPTPSIAELLERFPNLADRQVSQLAGASEADVAAERARLGDSIGSSRDRRGAGRELRRAGGGGGGS